MGFTIDYEMYKFQFVGIAITTYPLVWNLGFE